MYASAVLAFTLLLTNRLFGFSAVIYFVADRTCNTTVTMVTVFATREYGMTQ